MSFEITGRLIEKFDTVQVTDRFRKREFVIEKKENAANNEFIETIKFQLTQDRCETLDAFKTGEEMKIAFNIRGRRWEKDGRVNYFNNLEAWRLEKMEQQQPGTPPQHSIEDIPPEPEDGLPF